MVFKKRCRIFFIMLTGIFFISTLFAQKLPNKQTTSVWATFDLSSNHQPTNPFINPKAHNTATDLYYIIANDDRNLFIMLRATDPLIIRKIIYGNISIKLAANKNEIGDGISITCPLLERKDLGIFGLFKVREELKSSPSEMKSYNDSLLTDINKRFFAGSSSKITGVSSLKDSLFHINTATELQTDIHFDNNSSLSCFLKIPLKYFSSAIIKNKIFYIVKLNGQFYSSNTTLTMSADGLTTTRSTPGWSSVVVKNTPESVVLDYPTDFSGEYTLAKKR